MIAAKVLFVKFFLSTKLGPANPQTLVFLLDGYDLHYAMCTEALRVGVAGSELHGALPIHLFRHFCCRMYCTAMTHSKQPNPQNSRIWNSQEQRGNVTITIPYMVFLAV